MLLYIILVHLACTFLHVYLRIGVIQLNRRSHQKLVLVYRDWVEGHVEKYLDFLMQKLSLIINHLLYCA